MMLQEFVWTLYVVEPIYRILTFNADNTGILLKRAHRMDVRTQTCCPLAECDHAKNMLQRGLTVLSVGKVKCLSCPNPLCRPRKVEGS